MAAVVIAPQDILGAYVSESAAAQLPGVRSARCVPLPTRLA